ncbi:MAG: T9SS type A sorting domain-containing protein [Bacteroidetes bacterium]|nr:T9SS type A sorting domain-containing protein [Bacteroidota bacterium]
MKSKLYFIIVSLFICASSVAQNPVPNPGFEMWSGGNASNWLSNNFTGLYVPITQSANAHLGNSSVKGEVVSYLGNNISPVLFSAPGGVQSGFQISSAYNLLKFYFKFVSGGVGDQLEAFVVIQDINGNGIAYSTFSINQVSNSWTLAQAPIIYSGSNPTNAVITFSIGNSNGIDPAVGSYFIIDDVSFDMASSLSENQVVSIGNLFPNPAKDQITFPFHLNKSGQAKLEIIDLQGRVIHTLLDQNLPAGDYRIQEKLEKLESGNYFCRLRFENSEVSKLFQVHHK